jgi:choline dehydrogenase
MELMDAFISAAKEAGIPENPDYNGASQEGVAYFQLTIRNGLRCSAAKAYLAPAKGRANLRIETEALSSQLLLEGRRVTGVAYRQGGGRRIARARREVILSAGAIGSPQLLLLSGIGPARELKAQGIEVALDLPGVGKHLQDHYQARIVYRCPRAITLNDINNSLWRRGLAGAEWALFRKGPLTVGAGVVALFWKTREELASPDVEFHVIPFSSKGIGQSLHSFPGYTVSVCQLRPESRGELTLRDADPLSLPVIRPNYLATESDRRTMVDGMKLARRVMGQPAIQPYIEAEEIPGPGCADDAALLDYVRGTGTTIFHPASTCMMGPSGNPGAVVDARLRVHGLEGLRVADASIMPTVISGNTNAPSIMIGEKAAAMIVEDARARLAA